MFESAWLKCFESLTNKMPSAKRKISCTTKLTFLQNYCTNSRMFLWDRCRCLKQFLVWQFWRRSPPCWSSSSQHMWTPLLLHLVCMLELRLSLNFHNENLEFFAWKKKHLGLCFYTHEICTGFYFMHLNLQQICVLPEEGLQKFDKSKIILLESLG